MQFDLRLALKIGVYLLACELAHCPVNWMIRKIIKKWRPESSEPSDKMGAFLGTLERITILLVGLESFAGRWIRGDHEIHRALRARAKGTRLCRIFSCWHDAQYAGGIVVGINSAANRK